MKKIGLVLGLAMGSMIAFEAHALPNPWIDCGEDLICGAQKAGFSFPLQVKNYKVRAMQDMMEIRFPLDENRNVVVRKSTMSEGEADENGIIDISGDYNHYPLNDTVTLDNGVKFSVRGEEDSYKVVNFAAETGYYSITCEQGLSRKDIEYFYKLLEEAEAPKYEEE
jgi:hypothetical protein